VTSGAVLVSLVNPQFSPSDCSLSEEALRGPNHMKTFSTGNEVSSEIDIVLIEFCKDGEC
jgi:hypothetical protein